MTEQDFERPKDVLEFSIIKDLFDSLDPAPIINRQIPLRYDTRNKTLGDRTVSSIERHVDGTTLYVSIGKFRFDISEGNEVSFLISPPIIIEETGVRTRRPGSIRFSGHFMTGVAHILVNWAKACFTEDRQVEFPFPTDPNVSPLPR